MDEPVVAGVDVGGARKGFHAVALHGFEVSCFASRSAEEVAQWCRDRGAVAVGVDAPCGWSATGSSRRCERELRTAGVKLNCFATPTRERAVAHTRGFYDWVFCAEPLYAVLAGAYPIYTGGSPSLPCSFETFPHAVVCALAGCHVPARDKNRVRRQAVREEILDDRALRNLDFVDAALCAIAARFLVAGDFTAFGDAEEGLIVVPFGG